MKNFICLILCVLIVSASLSVLSASAVDDQALVFDPALTAEIDAFNAQLRLAADFEVNIITRDFLGGKNVRTFTNQTLESFDSSSSGNLLLVMVIGEDSYEVALGSNAMTHISHDKVERLLSDTFRVPFLRRDYNEAVASFLVRLGEILQAQTGFSLPESSRLPAFARQEPVRFPMEATKPQDDNGIIRLGSIFENFSHNEESARQYSKDASNAQENKDNGLSLFQIALIGFILFKIFGKKQNGRRKGCGPLGWIFGAWGISRFFGWRR
jgi:hypothetical protein